MSKKPQNFLAGAPSGGRATPRPFPPKDVNRGVGMAKPATSVQTPRIVDNNGAQNDRGPAPTRGLYHHGILQTSKPKIMR